MLHFGFRFLLGDCAFDFPDCLDRSMTSISFATLRSLVARARMEMGRGCIGTANSDLELDPSNWWTWIYLQAFPRAIVAVALSRIKFFSRKRGEANAAFLPLAIVSFFAVSDVALRDPLIRLSTLTCCSCSTLSPHRISSTHCLLIQGSWWLLKSSPLPITGLRESLSCTSDRILLH